MHITFEGAVGEEAREKKVDEDDGEESSHDEGKAAGMDDGADGRVEDCEEHDAVGGWNDVVKRRIIMIILLLMLVRGQIEKRWECWRLSVRLILCVGCSVVGGGANAATAA